MKRSFLFLALCAVAVFSTAIWNPLYFDDLFVIRDNAWLHGLRAPGYWFGTPYVDSGEIFPGFRPILMLSFLANQYVWPGGIEALRIGNILLHTLNACLLFSILQAPTTFRLARWTALGAALFFLLHPLQTLAINFLWKRSTLLETTFLLTGILVHLYERRRESYRLSRILLHGLLMSAAVLTKESGVLYPLLLASVNLCVHEKDHRWNEKKNLALYAFLIALGAFFLYFRLELIEHIFNRNRTTLPNRRLLSSWGYMKTSLALIPKYIELLFHPQPRVMDDPTPASTFPVLGTVISAVAFFGSAIVGWMTRRSRWIPFALLLFWLPLLPTLGPVPLFLSMDQIRLYLPLAGFAILFSMALTSFGERIFNARTLIIIIALTYGVTSIFQNLRYRKPELIWKDVAETYPESGLAWDHYGSTLQDQGKHAEAAEAYQHAANAEPDHLGYVVRSLYNLLKAGTPAKDVEPILVKIPVQRLSALDLVNLAIIWGEIGDAAKAESLLLDSVGWYPSFGYAHLNLAILLDRQKRFSEALDWYRKSALLLPNDTRAPAAIERIERDIGPK